MSPAEPPAESSDDATPEAEPNRPPATYTSEELFRGTREIWIEHSGELYRLRITSRGKLILTK